MVWSGDMPKFWFCKEKVNFVPSFVNLKANTITNSDFSTIYNEAAALPSVPEQGKNCLQGPRNCFLHPFLINFFHKIFS